MTTQTYQQLSIEEIKGLPPEVLAEIADFVYFVRKRALQPQAFEEEIQNALLRLELKQLSRDEEAHLEKEFETICNSSRIINRTYAEPREPCKFAVFQG